MSYLATELEALIIEKEKTAADISRESGVDQATLSRIRTRPHSIRPEALDRIALGLGPDPRIHARLLAAQLRDQLRPPGGSLIEIDVLGTTPAYLREQPGPRFGAKLTPKNQQILDILARNLHDTDVRNILEGVANLCESENLSGNSSSSKDTSDKSYKAVADAGADAVPDAPPKKPKAP